MVIFYCEEVIAIHAKLEQRNKKEVELAVWELNAIW
jgi:hypothetical protein